MMAALRASIGALTDALDTRGADEVIYLDPETWRVLVDSRLDDVDTRVTPHGIVVPAPGGLYEWQVRRDFVRSLPAGTIKTRLGDTLGGPRTRRRFEVTLATTRDPHVRAAFRQFRRRRLRAYAARVMRGVSALAMRTTAYFDGCVPEPFVGPSVRRRRTRCNALF